MEICKKIMDRFEIKCPKRIYKTKKPHKHEENTTKSFEFSPESF
jgi:hypothetical protein